MKKPITKDTIKRVINQYKKYKLSLAEEYVVEVISQEIADELVIEVKTVKNHINNMYSKLNMSSRYQAISRSVRVPLLKDAQYDQPENDANN